MITRRAVDTGDLIDSGGKTLFVLTQMDPLRIYINVPQSYAQLVKPGQKVVVTQAELRGKTFAGEVVRTAGSIDSTTRTMQVEVKLSNRDGALMPGAFVQVSLPLSGGSGLVVPTNVLLFRGEGTRVAVVDAASKVRLRAVTLGRNLGEAIEIVDGIGPRDRLVVNPSDSLAEGDAVAINAAADDAAAAGAASGAVVGTDRREGLASTPVRSRRLGLVGAFRVARRRRSFAGCVAGPDYVRPEVAPPPAWQLEEPGRAGAPHDAAPKGPWQRVSATRASMRCSARRWPRARRSSSRPPGWSRPAPSFAAPRRASGRA